MKSRRFCSRSAVMLAICLSYSKAQTLYQGSKPSVPPEEEAAIEIGRKRARTRPIAPSKPLNSIESVNVRIFKSSKPSVVYISSSTERYKLKNPLTGDIFDMPPGTGTGFVWDNFGHVVTNHHVIEVDDENGIPIGEAENLQVTLSDGKAYVARVIGKSLVYDIAVLRVFAPWKNMKPLPLGSSKNLQVGQSVLAIGNPFGFDHTLTKGIISGLGREVITSETYQRRIRGAIQTDAAINPGNSGGPLLDSSGRLIGMNTSVKSKSGGYGGNSFGFAIPADTMNRVVPVLIAKGQLDRQELGFTTILKNLAARLGISRGAVVSTVAPGSIAEKSGLRGIVLNDEGVVKRMGDVIVGFQGKPIDSEIQLLDLLELEFPDAELVFDVLREGKPLKIIMRPGQAKPAKTSEESSL